MNTRTTQTLPNRDHSRRGQTIVMFVMFAGALMGMCALAFDLSTALIVRRMAQAAVDSAVLAGVREAENGAAEVGIAATRAFHGNFPAGTMLSSGITVNPPVITPVPAGNEVKVVAQVVAPAYFARYLGRDSFTINVSARAVRRARNVILVLDNTNSVGSDFGALKTAASAFVDEFDDNLDRVGLVVFARSARLAYPPSTNFKAGIKAEIQALHKEYGTGSPMGLWLAHNTLMALNDTARPHDIVWFTDGRANTCPLQAVVKTTGSQSCTTPNINALFGIQGNRYDYSKWFTGFDPVDPESSVLYQPSIPECSGVTNKNNALISINSTWTDPSGTDPTMSLNNGLQMSVNRPDLTPSLTNFSNGNFKSLCRNWTMNFADQLRQHSPLREMTIHALGFKNVWQPDLKAIVNHPTSASYDPAYRSGLYFYTDQADELVSQFRRVASTLGLLTQ